MMEHKVYKALFSGNLDDFRELLQEFGVKEVLESVDDDDATPLHLAIENGHTELASYILDLKGGADPNALNKYLQSPVHYACFEGNAEILRLLISRGGNVLLQDDELDTPLHLASSEGIESGNTKEVLEILLQHGAKVNEPNDIGDTALHNAARYGSMENAQVLLEHGATVAARNMRGRTPLDLTKDTATRTLLRMHQSLQSTLLAQEQGGSDGDTPAAASKNHEAILEATEHMKTQLDNIMKQQEENSEKMKDQFSTTFQQNRALKAETTALQRLLEQQHEEHNRGLDQLARYTSDKLDVFWTQVVQAQQQATVSMDATMSCPGGGEESVPKPPVDHSAPLLSGQTTLDVMQAKVDHMTMHCMFIEVMLFVMACCYLWKNYSSSTTTAVTASSPTSSSSTSKPSSSSSKIELDKRSHKARKDAAKLLERLKQDGVDVDEDYLLVLQNETKAD